MSVSIAAFPKCYIDQIAGERTMSVFDWIEMARSLDADGLEMYDGFLHAASSRITSTRWARRFPRRASRCRCSAARPISPIRTLTHANGPSTARPN